MNSIKQSLLDIPMEQCLTRLTLAPFHNFFVIEKEKNNNMRNFTSLT